MDTRYYPKWIRTRVVNVVWILVIISAITGFPIRANDVQAQTAPPYWRDEFDADSLDPVWYWVNENSDKWNLTERPGYLRIYTSPDMTGGENLLLQPAGPDDFVIQTHLFFEPSTNFQFAGLVIYQDQGNFLQFGRAFCDVPDICVGNGIYFDKLVDGGFSGSNYATPTASQNQAFLRLVRQGQMVTAFYSEGGIAWQLIGTHELSESFVVNAVGLTASQDDENILIAADFDYFSLTTYSKLPSPFIGNWQAIDVDGSDLRMAIAGPPHGPFQITLTDKYISFCGGEAGIVRGTGWLNDSDLNVLDADLHLSCFTTGATLDFHLVWRYHPATNTLSSRDGSGLVIIWHRPGRPQPSPPTLNLRVNYGHDWVESFYEVGHMVWVTVTESDGVTVKATADLVTDPKDFWNGETGFQTRPEDWAPGPPDIQPNDWVYGWVDNGASAQVQIGDISGMIHLAADSIEGAIDAPWFSSNVDVECFPWGAPEPQPEMKFDSVVPDGADKYECSWLGEWDIQPEQDVGVGYFGLDGHWVANAFSLPESIQWLAAYTYDSPVGTFRDGVHLYHFEFEWTSPEPGTLSGQGGELLVSSEAALYDGYVLLRGPSELGGIDTPDGLACEGVDAIHPEQPTRFLVGWVTDSPMTYGEATAHFESITARVVWDDGVSAELIRQEIFPFSPQLDWAQYVCTFTR